MRYPQDIVARIRQLAIDCDDDEIAASLDREGLKSATSKRFTASMISWVRFKHRIPGPARPCGTLSVGEVAQRFGVKPSVVYYWIETGIIEAKRRKPGTPYAITITDETGSRPARARRQVHTDQDIIPNLNWARCSMKRASGCRDPAARLRASE